MSDQLQTETALVLFSGGQDSATCLAWALQRFKRVEMLGFDYGQRHAIELESRGRLLDGMKSLRTDWAERLGESHTLDIPTLADISDTALTRDVAIAMGEEMRLDADARETLRLGALLHDIGKIGVPDEVLRKPGALTAAEYETIKTHPSAGARILRSIPFLAPHIPIVELHHERPDGLGYPYGLRGDEIPLAARIVHVADAFDAMTTARAYRPAQTSSHAVGELWRYAGSQFDTEVVEAFVAAWSAMPVPDDQSVPTAPSATVLPFDRGDTGRSSA